MDWKNYIKKEYLSKLEELRTSDKVLCICFKCEEEVKIILSNLKRQVKKHKCFLCRSCAGRKGNKKGKNKYIRTMKKRYGVSAPLKNKEILKKSQETSKRRYGEEGTLGLARKKIRNKYNIHNMGHLFKVPEIKRKSKSTMINKYGVESLLKLDHVRNKNAYFRGLKNVSQDPEIKEKVRKSFKEKYGGYNLENPAILKKAQKKRKEKSEKAQEVIKNDLIRELEATGKSPSNPEITRKYGFSFGILINILRKEGREDLITDDSIQSKLKVNNLYEAGKKIAKYCKDNNFPPTQIGKEIGISHPSIKKCLYISGDSYLYGKFKSKPEKEILNFLLDYIPKEKIYKGRPKFMKNLELDFYLPEYKIAIEFNGLYWHCEINKPKNYHKIKRELCEKEGYQLIMINQDEWMFQKEKIKSLILNKLNLCSRIEDARNLEFRKVNYKEAKKFLEENHLMGSHASSRAYGLYKKRELISLITLKKNKDSVEISRFCSKLFTSVRGGFSKLLKNYEKIKRPKKIISFVDLRFGQGESLKNLGFTPNKTHIGWKWTDFEKTYNRLYCKANMDTRGLSQREHAEELGLYKIFDSGQKKFIKLLQ